MALDFCDDADVGIRWKRVNIFSDCREALQWLQQPWKRDRQPKQYATSAIRQSIARLKQHRHVDLHFWWIPAHSGIDGNVRADAAAVEASALPLDQSAHSGSVSSFMRTVKHRLTAVEQESWEASSRGSIREISPLASASNLEVFARIPESLVEVLLQFRSNTLAVSTHRNADTRSCTCAVARATTSEQTREHLLLECRLLEERRRLVLDLLPASKPHDVATILQGGVYADQQNRERYLANLEAFLRDARPLITTTNRANSVFAPRSGRHHHVEESASTASLQSDESLREVSERQWQRGHDNARALELSRAKSASDSQVPLPSNRAQVQTAPEEVEPVLPHCSQQAEGPTGVDGGTSSRQAEKRGAVESTPAESSSESGEEELWETMAAAGMEFIGNQGSAPLSKRPSGEGPSRPRKRRVFKRRPSPPAPTESDEEEAMWKILAEAG